MTDEVRIAAETQRLRGWREAVPWAVIAADLAFATAVTLVAGLDALNAPLVGVVLFMSMVVSLGTVGALVITRKPRDPVGWILWLSATMVTIAISGADYVRLSLTSFDGTLPATTLIAWLQGLVFLPAVCLITVVVPLYFPDGKLLGARWRWVIALAVAAIVAVTLPPAFDPGPLANTAVDNPLAIPGFQDLDWLLTVSNIALLVAFPLAIGSLVLRYRRGSETTRRQIKWFAAAAGFTIAAFLLAVAGPGPLADVGWVLGLFGVVLMPVAIGIGILRYRLYEIDRIISRTIGWAIVTGTLVATFAAVVVGLQSVLAPVTESNTLAVAGSTLVVFALFQPVRRRVQRGVDRRFNRSRYDAQKTVDAFAGRLRDGVDLEAVTDDLRSTTSTSVSPRHVGFWLRNVHNSPPPSVS
jgi:hypothetical protein